MSTGSYRRITFHRPTRVRVNGVLRTVVAPGLLAIALVWIIVGAFLPRMMSPALIGIPVRGLIDYQAVAVGFAFLVASLWCAGVRIRFRTKRH